MCYIVDRNKRILYHKVITPFDQFHRKLHTLNNYLLHAQNNATVKSPCSSLQNKKLLFPPIIYLSFRNGWPVHLTPAQGLSYQRYTLSHYFKHHV